MAENNEKQLDADAGPEEEKAETSTFEKPEPTLEEDFELLQRINVLKAVMVRMQGGRHPSPEIDALLQRRLNFSRETFQGPYIIRLISTLIMIFVAATLCWGILWILASGFELSYFLRILSTGMATLVAAIAGVAIFHPSSLPDEKLLKEAVDDKMQQISKQVQELSGSTSAERTDQADDLIDSSIEELSSPRKQQVKADDEPLAAMPKGLDGIRESQSELQDDELPGENNDKLPDSEKVDAENDETNTEEDNPEKKQPDSA
jgi:hypothetical protein